MQVLLRALNTYKAYIQPAVDLTDYSTLTNIYERHNAWISVKRCAPFANDYTVITNILINNSLFEASS